MSLTFVKSVNSRVFCLFTGAAYSYSETAVRKLVQTTGLPVLATPMGKGVVADSSHLSVASARTLALQQADVILLLGARLNWMLHFGRPPRFNKKVSIIQVSGTSVLLKQSPLNLSQ